MRGAAFGAAVFGILQLASQVSGISCGDNTTQVTICFRGTGAAANCEFVVTNSSVLVDSFWPCLPEPLFGGNCTILLGILKIAYGTCQSLQTSLLPKLGTLAPAQSEMPVRPVLGWLELLGLQEISEVGALLVRSYAFQLELQPSTIGLPILPNLSKIGNLRPSILDAANTLSLSILGVAVPPLHHVTQLDDGMLIENTPNTNFSNIFPALQNVRGPITIVGNAQLTSLDGLQRVTKENMIGNFQIIGNPRLQDISALGTSLRCKDGVPGSVNSTAVLGVIQVVPKDPFPFWNSCLMSTAGQICQFIGNRLCPPGTEYDGEAVSSVPTPAPSP